MNKNLKPGFGSVVRLIFISGVKKQKILPLFGGFSVECPLGNFIPTRNRRARKRKTCYSAKTLSQEIFAEGRSIR